MFVRKVAAVAALLSLAACGGVSSGSADPQVSGSVAAAADLSTCTASDYTLKITYGVQGGPAVELAMAQMQKKFPGLKFDAPASSSSSYNDLTKQVVANAAVGKPDDLIMSGLGQLRFWVDSYHPAEIDQSKLPDGYQKQFLQAGTVDGKVYLAPFQVSAPALLVNRTLLKQAGLNPDAPLRSYAEWTAAAKAITAKTGKPSVNVSTDNLPDWFAQAFVQSAGTDYVADDGSAGFDSPEGVKALGIWSTLAADKTLLNVGFNDALAQFNAGTLPFLVGTTSVVATVQKAVASKFDWMPVDLPTLDGTAKGPLPAGGNGWIVLSQDACKAAYANEMVAMMLDKDVSLKASGTSYSYIPVNKHAADELLGGPSATPQLKYSWSYDKALSVWGGFKGTATAQVFDLMTTMTQQLSTGADAQQTVTSTATQVDSAVGAA